MDELVVDFLNPDGTLWETVVFPPDKHELIQEAAIALNVSVGEFILDSLREAVENYPFEQTRIV